MNFVFKDFIGEEYGLELVNKEINRRNDTNEVDSSSFFHIFGKHTKTYEMSLFKNKNTGERKPFNIRFMHVLNIIAIVLFLAAILYKIFISS